jgi:hypothetical protein
LGLLVPRPRGREDHRTKRRVVASTHERGPRSRCLIAGGLPEHTGYDGRGNFYVSDSGDRAGKKGAVFKIDAGKKASLVLDAEANSPPILFPNGVLLDDDDHLLIADFSQGYLFRLDLKTKKLERIGSGFGGTDGLAKDARGRRFVGDWKNGKLFELLSENEPPRLLSDMFRSAADIALMPDGNTLLVPDMKAGTLTWFPVR